MIWRSWLPGVPSVLSSHAPGTSPGKSVVIWALVRLSLGFGQIAGATAGLILLLRTGVNRYSVGAVALTGVFTVLSRLLFRRRAFPHQPNSSSQP